MAAGQGFKTFATGDVLTAADTNGYLMQGVWTFADAAARTAAVTSPQEGNFSYLKSDDTTYYYNGSAWTAIGGGMTLLSTTSLSGATTTISSISQNYKTLVAFIYGVTNATANGIFRIAPNGATNQSAGIMMYNNGNSATGPVTIGGNTYINTVLGLTRTDAANSMFLQINNYTNASVFQNYIFNGYIRSASPGDMQFTQTGSIGNLAAITSLVFSNAGGNLSTGTVLLYGVA